ncbi:SDR family NAD(P)-dependent oxidoreductase [Saccharopolyspora shandongensis]|uniref:SDR family NAD(P)-dependent oxidoreductase n=1 Tax=Saccharopolyspora shandongensis TaxID=418495 RepID=UPI0033E61229
MTETDFDGATEAAELVFPASFAQERMWFLHRLRPDEPHYNSQVVLDATGPLDHDALRAALRAVVQRHEILRTRFAERDAALVQIVAPEVVPELTVVDGPADRSTLREVLLRHIDEPFDLETGPLLRCVVFRLGPDHHVLLFCLHHIIADGWTLNLLAAEFGAAYRTHLGGGAPWKPLEIQYADFSEWQREHLSGDVLRGELDYWRERLGAPLPVLDLPTDRPRPDSASSAGARANFALDAELTAAIRKLAAAERATPFMILLAAFGVLLQRHSGQDDLVVGTPVACRESEQVKPLLGLFMNTVALRLDLGSDPTFRELLGQAREVCLGAYGHQDVPLDKVVEEVRPPRLPGRSPLFDVLFALQNPPRLDLGIDGVVTTALEVERVSTRFDLELHFWEHADRFTGAVVFATDLFERATIARLAEQLGRLLESAVAEPDSPVSRLALLPAGEQARSAVPAADHPVERDLAAEFARCAAASPAAAAIVLPDGRSISYGELDEQSQRLAAQLAGIGVGPGSRVGIHFEPGVPEVVSTLAVLRRGAVCVPINPADPAPFQRRIAGAGAPDFVLTGGAGAEDLGPGAVIADIDGLPEPAAELPAEPVDLDAPAFALWSGSGATLLSHRVLGRQLLWFQQNFPLSEEDRVESGAAPGVGRAIWERLWPLLNGAAVAIGGSGTVAFRGALLDRGAAGRHLLHQAPGSGLVLGAGDPITPATEPLHLLDRHGAPTPPGARGEICFGTALTRTGAIGRWNADGLLEVLEPTHQLGGYPATAADIAATVLRDEAVRDCEVRSARTESGAAVLIAYVVPEGKFSARRLDELVRAEWPAELVPAGFVPVSALPRRDSGAVDGAELDRLPLLEEEVARRWEAELAARPGVEQAAVVIADVPAERGRIHLGDLAPGAGDAAIAATAVRAEADDRQVPAISFGADLGELAVDTLPAALHRAGREPRRGITYLDGGAVQHAHSYAELINEASEVLHGLRRLGLRPGDIVILQLDRNPDVIAAFWGCVLGGFVPVPMATPPSYEVDDAVVGKLVNAHEMFGRPWVLTGAALADGIRGLAARHGWPAAPLAVLEELRGGPADLDWHPAKPDDLAFMLLTSGSTGRPKAVQLSHHNVLARAAGTAAVNGFTETDVSFNWMPLDHVGGIQMSHIRDVYTGCDQVHVPIRWVLEDPLRWLACIDQYRASITWAPNFAFGLIADRADEVAGQGWDLSCLRHILNAGEAIAAKTTRRFLRLLIPMGLPADSMNPEWGMSETSSTVTFSAGFSLADTSDDDPNVAVGAPYPGVGLRIVGDDGDVLAEGAEGALQVTGRTVTAGYYENPEQNAQSFTDDGWFDTGDLGHLRGGVLTITGRAKDVVIINGVNYYSHEIEAAVEELEAVENSFTAACGVRDAATTTDQVVIFFHLREGFDEARTIRDIRAQVVQRIGINPAYLVPVAPETIPKTEIGKIQRTQLRNRFQDGEFTAELQRVDLLLGNERTLPNWFYRPVWRPAEVRGTTVPTGGCTVVLTDRHGLGELLAEALRQRGVPCVEVVEAASFERRGESRYALDPAVAEHYEQLFAAVQGDGFDIDRIVDLAGYAPLDAEDAESALAAGRLPLLSNLSTLTTAAVSTLDPGRSRSLLVVTSHAVAVRDSDEAAVDRLPLGGFVKSIGQEVPWLRGRHIDLPMRDRAADARLLLAELASAVPDDQVAYRDGRRWVPRLALLDEPADAAPGIRSGGLYVLSGGLGGIGTEIADLLLTRYDTRLLLLGRTELPSEGDEALRALQAKGEVSYAAVDVCDEERVRSAVAEAEKRWGMELSGVLHLAGRFEQLALAEQTPGDLDRLLAAKVRGAWTLHRLVRERPGALFVSFSSVNGFFGGATASGYAAANAFLDGLAVHQRRLGLLARSLAWSMWDEVGASRGSTVKELTRARGFHLLNRGEGANSFLAALRHDQPCVLIGLDASKPAIEAHLDAPMRPLRKLVGYVAGAAPGGELQVLDDLDRPTGCELRVLADLPTDASGGIDREALRRNDESGAARAAHVAPANEVERLVASVWSEVLDVERIGMHDNFFDLAGNSLLLTRVHGRLEEATGRAIPLVELFRYPTPAALSGFLAEAAETGRRDRGKQRAERRLRARRATRSDVDGDA